MAQLLLGNLFQCLIVLIIRKFFLKSSQRYKDCNKDKRTIYFQNKVYLIYTTSEGEKWVSGFISQFNELGHCYNTSVEKTEKVKRNPKLLEIHTIKVSLSFSVERVDTVFLIQHVHSECSPNSVEVIQQPFWLHFSFP